MVKLNRFRFWGRSPLAIVELIIGFFSVVSGIYVASPLALYSAALHGATPLVATLGSPIALIAFGAVLGLSGIFIIVSVWRRNYKLRSAALFMNILCRTYGLIVVFLVQGFLPLTWVPSLMVLLITVVCYMVVRGCIVRGDIHG